MSDSGPELPVWVPNAERVARANLSAFLRWAQERGLDGTEQVRDYASLWRWSVERTALFWGAVWDFCGIVGERGGDEVLVGGDRMAPPDAALGPRWFPAARINFAENLLRYADDRPALVAWDESGRRSALSYAALNDAVARVARALRAQGVRVGDRVAGLLPNIPETVIAMLGAASIGAIWSSCSPDFGVNGVLDRFGQIAPRVLIAVDGYRYAGKAIDLRDRIAEIRRRIPAIERVVIVPYLSTAPAIGAIDNAIVWDAWIAEAATPDYVRLPFDHPLYIMYSSGTTGLPKCMVHGAGGTLIQHLKELVLHTDVRRDDRLFYFTTCGWMMWNWLVSGLAVGATLVLYDGAPLTPPAILWDMAAHEGVTIFGTSAKYLALAEKAGLTPARTHDLSALRTILSTGSPLASHSFDYVYAQVKADVHLASISGGTDIVSCFALGNPTGAVWRGELQARGLGMAVEVFDAEGRSLVEAEGELVCTRPFPSMPVQFWNDPAGAKYRGAYFDRYPNVWRHGDWARLTEHDGLVILGRSDTTLNPGGVRIGTAEIYRQVEQLPEVVESVVIGQEWDGDVRTVLFVRLRDGLALDEDLRDRLRRRIREHATPHHVPRKIVQVADLPRTISGKISEVAVRDVVHGRPVANVDALANPAALELFRDLAELRV